MSIVVHKYQIYCNTENCFVYGYGTEAPTTCYNNTNHAVNPDSVSIVETISTTRVALQLEDTPTGGYYGCGTWSFDAAPNATTVYATSFPMNTTMLAAQLQVTAEMVGDYLDFNYAQDTTIGIATVPPGLGDTTISVSPTVLQYAVVGYYIRAFNGVAESQLGRIVSIDKVGATITVETPCLVAYDGSLPVYMQITRYFIKNYELRCVGIHKIGFAKMGGGLTPAGVIGRCIYKNNGNTTKRVGFMIEHFF
jgi:hypothetical protein